jgi:hypothetical protein
MTDAKPKTIATPRAARLLGKCQGTLKGWRRKGIGPPFFKLGGEVRYHLSDVLQYATQGETERRSEQQ